MSEGEGGKKYLKKTIIVDYLYLKKGDPGPRGPRIEKKVDVDYGLSHRVVHKLRWQDEVGKW